MGLFFCIIDGGAWSLVLRHDKWILYSSAWSSDFLMNGRTTKLLLARGKRKGSSINDVRNWEGVGSKIGQNWRHIALKKWRHGGGGVKISEKLPTLFMDGPKEEGRQNNGKLFKTVYYSTLILLRIEFVASCQPNKLREVLRSKQMVDKIGEFLIT